MAIDMKWMLHIIFSFSITVLYTFHCYAQTESTAGKKSPYLLDRSIIFSFKSDTDSIPVQKYIYKYDSDGNNNSTISQEWDKISKKWVSYEKKDYIYNPKGQVVSFMKFNWEGDQWVPNEQKIETAFNDAGLEILKTHSVYNRKDKAWSYSSKTESTYDASGKKILEMIFLWDPAKKEWYHDVKNERSFDEKGRETRFQTFVWSNNNWVFTHKHVMRYNSNHKTLDVVIEWDGLKNKWNYKKDSVINFDKNGNPTLTQGYTYDVETGIWVMNSKLESTYDAKNNELSRVFSQWDSVKNTSSKIKAEFTYDAKSQKNSESVYVWDAQKLRWNAERRYEYTFDIDPKHPLVEYQADAATNQFMMKQNTIITKDKKGNIISKISNYNWDPATKKCRSTREQKFFYDSDGNLRLMVYTDKDLTSAKLKGYEKVYHFYLKKN